MLRERVLMNTAAVADTTIAAAIYIWAANLYLADESSLRQHANTVRALVDARDGLFSLGMSGSIANLFQWVEIMNNIRLNSPCNYPDERVLAYPRSSGRRYGTFWESDEVKKFGVEGEAVITACRECCRCLDLIENDADDVMAPKTYWYLYQRTAQLYQENSRLRTKYAQTHTAQECMVLAVDILKLIAFNGGQTRPPRRSLTFQANNLGTGGSTAWQEHVEMLIWLVMIAALASPGTEQRQWCYEVLQGALECKLGTRGKWPSDWQHQLWSALARFGWSTLPPFDHIEVLWQNLGS
ncbi:hypothetical protein LTR05_008731 [Lithohypha guttulata]|uniref:Uncharacterized protein n=1 Tax=Lithohypha guttulata TaxID=1690604 RepID=A0AAN7PJG4_9EURO|nr:hypothetical protein LTR05_008731 [Lithohypha guttulata]